jgi:hypothetical protein
VKQRSFMKRTGKTNGHLMLIGFSFILTIASLYFQVDGSVHVRSPTAEDATERSVSPTITQRGSVSHFDLAPPLPFSLLHFSRPVAL